LPPFTINFTMHIAISGNIGSGKTTLTSKLAKHFNWMAEYEAVEDNPYLVDFYQDMQKWAFHLQIYFLNSRFNQVNNIRNSKNTVIQDRTIYEDAYIFATNLYHSGYLNLRDFRNYMSIFDSISCFVQPPDLLIYLRADIPRLVKGIQKRGRDYESTISLNYLQSLNEHYENWIKNYKLGKLLIIDVNEVDFVQNIDDFADIVNRIDVDLNGLFK
jgi:deoxyadenosine/deoxycytidine kinase